MPQTILLNPLITPLEQTLEEGWEGCLSVPGLRGLVARYPRLVLEGFNVEGTPVRVEAEGLHALHAAARFPARDPG